MEKEVKSKAEEIPREVKLETYEERVMPYPARAYGFDRFLLRRS